MASGTGRDRSRGGPSPEFPREGAPSPPAIGRSTIGRPRALTDQQVEAILVESARFCAWRALRHTVKSQRQLAAEFGVSQATISLAIRSGGRYKQVSPDERAAEAKRRRDRLAGLRSKGLL
jgi:hypothetical protein